MGVVPWHAGESSHLEERSEIVSWTPTMDACDIALQYSQMFKCTAKTEVLLRCSSVPTMKKGLARNGRVMVEQLERVCGELFAAAQAACLKRDARKWYTQSRAHVFQTFCN